LRLFNRMFEKQKIITMENSETNHTEMTKLEFMSLSILNGLMSNPNWSSYREIDSNELTTKSVELAKLLLEKLK
jgi:hypothetical protein